MLGSSASIADCNVVINTAVAESLRQFADTLENSTDFHNDLHFLIINTIKQHKRIIFNGNGYDEAWTKEAQKRGLLNLRTTPDALPYLLHEKNVELFTCHKVFSETELRSRFEILLENYCKIINIEALTMLDMAKKDILPAVSAYTGELADSAMAKKSLISSIDCSYETETVERLSQLTALAYANTKALEKAVSELKSIEGNYETALYCKDSVIKAMEDLRAAVDELETITSTEYWPYPSYGDLLFGVK